MTCSNSTANNRPLGAGYNSQGNAVSLVELSSVSVSSVAANSISPLSATTLYVHGNLSANSYLGVTATTSPAGSNTQVQFNANGFIGAHTGFVYASGTETATVTNGVIGTATVTTGNTTTANITTANVTTLNATGTVNGISLDDLDQVSIVSEATGDLLAYTGAAWVDVASSTLFGNYATTAHNHAISSVSDATITTPTTGQALCWNNASQRWVNSSIGSFQPLDATLTTIAALTPGANNYIYFTAGDTATTGTITTEGRAILDDTTYTAVRTTIGLSGLAVQNIGGATTNVQFNAGGFMGGDARMHYTSGTGSFGASSVSATTFSGVSLSGSLRDTAVVTPGAGQALCWNNTTQRWVASAIGSFQPLDATLNAFASATTASNVLLYFSATDSTASCTLTSGSRLFLNVTGTIATGDILYANTSTQVLRLAAGSNGGLLFINGSGKPQWSDAPSAGGMWYFDGANVVRLEPGADGAVLTMSAGVPTWVGP